MTTQPHERFVFSTELDATEEKLTIKLASQGNEILKLKEQLRQTNRVLLELKQQHERQQTTIDGLELVHDEERILAPAAGDDRHRSIVRAFRAACYVTGADYEAFLSKRRNQPLPLARHLAWTWLYRQGFTLAEIGRASKRDHTTVLHGIRWMDNISAAIRAPLSSIDTWAQANETGEEPPSKYQRCRLSLSKGKGGVDLDRDLVPPP